MHTSRTVRAMPGRPLGGPSAWRGAELAQSDSWIRVLTAVELVELEAAADRVFARGQPLASVGRDGFTLPTLGPSLDDVRRELLHGRGFVLIRGLPVGRASRQVIATMLWGIGAHLGTAVPQNALGDLLGHVRDLGRDAADPSVRIYQTRERQGFHTDSADLVALLCLHPAAAGGRSTLVSCATVHDAMLGRCPELLAVLFEDFCTDHRGEHRPGSRPFFTAPILSYWAGELSVLYQRRYIESAQRFADVPRLTARQRAALDVFDATAEDPTLHLGMDLRPGDLQLIHNHQLLHDRTAFTDAPGGASRHLLRLWLCPPDGRALPPWFAERYGSVEVGRRGGVALSGTAPRLSLAP